jgi:hypothetical protein
MIKEDAAVMHIHLIDPAQTKACARWLKGLVASERAAHLTFDPTFAASEVSR